MTMNPVTHAKVKFLDSKQSDTVEIESIVQFKEKPPAHSKDFDKDAVYEWYDDETKECFAIQIGSLAAISNDDSLLNFENKRGNFMTLNDSTVKTYYEQKEKPNEEREKKNKQAEKVARKALESKRKAKEQEIQNQILQDRMKKLKDTEQLQLKSPVGQEKMTGLNNNLPSTTDRSSPSHLLLQEKSILQHKLHEMTERYNMACSNYDKLKKMYSECSEKLDNYRCFNEKLQMQLLMNSTEGNSMSVIPKKSIHVGGKQQISETDDVPKIKETNNNECQKSSEKHHLEQQRITSTPKSSRKRKLNDGTDRFDIPEAPSFDLTSTSSLFPRAPEEPTSKKSLNVTPEKKNEPAAVSSPDYESPVFDRNNKNKKWRRVVSRDSSSPEATTQSVGRNMVESKNDSPKQSREGDKIFDEATEESAGGNNNDDMIEDEENSLNQSKEGDNSADDDSNENETKNVGRDKAKLLKEHAAYFSKFRNTYQVKNAKGARITMIRLNNELSIPLETWMLYLKESLRYFTKKILRELYSWPYELSKRCVVESDVVRTPNGKNKRIMLSPMKEATIAKCVEYYVRKKLGTTDKEEVMKEVRKSNCYLTEDIGKAVTAVKNQIAKRKKHSKKSCKGKVRSVPSEG